MIPSLYVIGFAALGLAVAALIVYFVMLLWNRVLANVTAVRKITYVQALGLFILAKLLFGGFGGGHGWGKYNHYNYNAANGEHCEKHASAPWCNGDAKVEKK
jgi:hypothetical protein